MVVGSGFSRRKVLSERSLIKGKFLEGGRLVESPSVTCFERKPKAPGRRGLPITKEAGSDGKRRADFSNS